MPPVGAVWDERSLESSRARAMLFAFRGAQIAQRSQILQASDVRGTRGSMEVHEHNNHPRGCKRIRQDNAMNQGLARYNAEMAVNVKGISAKGQGDRDQANDNNDGAMRCVRAEPSND